MMTPILRPFQAFFRTESASGILLMGSAVLALLLANSPFAELYAALWQTTVTAGVGALMIEKPLLLWINDGLMALFFFVVGLEIKREILTGELASPRKAALALAAAVGGMVGPAALYVLMTGGTPFVNGWGVPMATDIAFALGVLALLGNRAPLTLKIFLTALAIVDDLGAVMVIALFYTSSISMTALWVSAGFLAALVFANQVGVTRTAVYVILGIGLWVAVLKSGVHATVAGVLLALTVPARRRIDAPAFRERVAELLGVFQRDEQPGRVEPTQDQFSAVHSIEDACEAVETPLRRMEHAMHGWVAYGVMPLFALANAGVSLGGDVGAMLSSPVAVGILVGLVLGKPLGVTAFSWLAVRTRLASLPAGVSWGQIFGVSLLTGIGFTMSIFISILAFAGFGPEVLDSAKLAILVASSIAGAAGALILMRTGREKTHTPR